MQTCCCSATSDLSTSCGLDVSLTGLGEKSKGHLAGLRPTAELLLQGTVVLGARDTAFSAAPGRAGAEAPALAGGHAALVTAIQVDCALRSILTMWRS